MNPEPKQIYIDTNMKEFQYHLEKYNGRATRHECPQCHDQHSFTYYVDDDGNIIDKSVGRCNHESGCGYHYTPKEWFRNNPDNDQPKRERVKRKQIATKPRDPDYIDKNYVLRSISFDSTFVQYLCGVLDRDKITAVWREYGCGATHDHSIIYWQIDTRGKVRTGKIMKYDPVTGHKIRIGNSYVDWVHSRLKKRGVLPDTFNLVQCLFGEHLLKRYPDKGVALVEAEKTALVGSALFPQYVWLATGGKSNTGGKRNLDYNKMRVLAGRRVVAFPDVDGYQEWKRMAVELSEFGIDISVSDILERGATPEERERKIDIADWMLAQLETNGIAQVTLSRMIQEYPWFGMLIEKLDLELVV